MSLPTLFPPIPKTVWRPGDTDILCLLGEESGGGLSIQDERGLAMRGPGIALDAGLYGVEYQLAAEQTALSPEVKIAEVQVTGGAGSLMLATATVTAGDLGLAFGGMYQGVRLDALVEGRIPDVEFRVVSLGGGAFSVHGIKLVPRPGRIWFPAAMDYERDLWHIAADRSAINKHPTLIASRGITLDAGDHRLGVKLKAPDGSVGDIAEIRVIGQRDDGGDEEIIAADMHISAEAVRANFGIPDARLRFRLAGMYRDVSIEVRALVPGVTIQWVRLATADEAVWHHYWNMGGMHSSLGLPVSAFETLGRSSRGLQGSARRFEGGAIYWTIEHGPCEVIGSLLARYESVGGYDEFGFPVSRPKKTGDKIAQQFEGGVLNATG
jgi:hypothetical protein